MKRRDGKTWPISARFDRLSRKKVVEGELDDLIEKVNFQAERLGYDLDDDETTDLLLRHIARGDESDPPPRQTEAEWAEHFLALAYAQTLIVFDDVFSEEVISALSIGNWAVGAVSGMSNRPSQALCIPCAIKEHASQNGKAGAAKKGAPFRQLESWARAKYREGHWPSANKAAHAMKEDVLAHGRAIGATLSEDNAQRTIAEWLRKKNVSV